MKTIILVALMTVASFGVFADYSNASPAANALMLRWDRFNEACRGGSGDDPATQTACKNREATYSGAVNLGWCRGPNGAAGHHVGWVICAAPVTPKPQVHAAEPASKMDRNSYCIGIGSLYDSVTGWRDAGMSPQAVFNLAKGFGLPEKDTKDVINNAYFNPALVNARGKAFAGQVIHTCLFGPPEPFTPLK